MFSKRALARKEYQFIPNGIDTDRFRFNPEIREQVRKELHCEEKLVIGNVGRLCYQKNQEFLLDIFARVYEKNANSMLLLVGEGEDKRMLEEKANRLGIRDEVIFYGTCQQIEKLYWSMDIFVFPSRFEGFGIAAIEAQAAGLPIVCSKNVPRETIITQNSFQVSLSDGIRAWAEILLKILNNLCAIKKETKMGVIKKAGFDLVDVTEMMEKTYNN